MHSHLSSKRVFIGPFEIAGYYANLARGFKEIGVDCDFVTYAPHPFGYGGETKAPTLLRLLEFLNQLRGKPSRTIILKLLVAVPRKILVTIWGFSTIFKYDVFIFPFGYSLLRSNIDLRILKLLNKTVISNLGHGSDARPAYIDGSFQEKNGAKYPGAKKMALWAKDAKARVTKHQQASSYTVGAPFSTSHFSSQKFINFFALGVPFDAADHLSIIDHPISKQVNLSNSICRILHSPSHPTAKGSPVVIQAIQSLKDKGYAIELVLLHGKPHSQIIQEIQRCDFVIDQLYSDTPMAGFATEAAWFGKPAVVGGYGLDYLKTFVLEGMWPPSKTCHPDEIEQAIESLIVNREERLRLGADAQNFVRAKWNAAEVARRYLRIIEGDIPSNWWLDPHSVTYLEGGGQPVERTQENIRQIVEQFGVESLQLSHRPDLEQAFLEFAGINPAADA